MAFFSFLTQANVCLLMCIKRNTVATPCPNMIQFDALDFSVGRSEEVMLLLMLSVFVGH